MALSSTLGAFPGGAEAADGASSWGQAGLGLWIFAAGTLLSRACFPNVTIEPPVEETGMPIKM